MPRPWVEATALLAAHGFRAGPPFKPQSPWNRLMSQNIDYAFLARVDAVAKPTVFGALDRLAAFIEAKRCGQGIQLEEIEALHERRRIAVGDSPAAPAGVRDRGVQIWTLLLDGTRDRSLGFAWLKGGGREDLQAALTRVALRKGIQPHPAAYAA